MDKYIESLEHELNKNQKLKDIENDVKAFKKVKLKELLFKLGYENEKIKSFVDSSVKNVKENGELYVSDEMIDVYSKQIKDDVISSAVTKNKEVIFLLGLPGSGKSSSLNSISKIYNNHKFYLIDADVFKEGKTDENEKEIISPLTDKSKNGVDVESVHEASSTLAKFITELLSLNDYNIALPKIGDNLEKLVLSINNLRQKGYKIYIHFLYTRVETALDRNLSRFLNADSNNERRRLVPAKYIYEVGYRPLYNFLLLIKENICDDYALWDGERCEIGKPKLLISRH